MTFSKNLKRSVAAIAVLPLACCAPTPAPSPAPAPARVIPRPAPPPAPMPAPALANWMDVPATAGDWTYRAISGRTQAVFGEPGQSLLVLTCNPQRRVVTLFRAGSDGSAVPVRILTETTDRVMTGNPSSEDNALIAVDIQGSDPLLDAMALSKGRFAVATAGLPTLYVPSWPEVTRVMEDCR